MPKTRLKIRFTLDSDYAGMVHTLMRYDSYRGTPSQYLAHKVLSDVADRVVGLWDDGHIWVPRRVLLQAVKHAVLADGSEVMAWHGVESEVARFNAMFDEAYGPGQDSPYWVYRPGRRSHS